MMNHNEKQNNNPNNFTFKTVFVNNFCLLPMNSSFTGRNKPNNNIKNTMSNNINSYKTENTFNQEKNLSNYRNSILLNKKKNCNLSKNNNDKGFIKLGQKKNNINKCLSKKDICIQRVKKILHRRIVC